MSRLKTKANKKKQKKKIITIKLPPYLTAALVLCAMMIIAVIISAIVVANREPKIEFIPPAFDDAAVAGTPEVPDDRGYNELYQNGMTFSVGICGAVSQENNELVVYFTNPKRNDTWLKLRVIDEQGHILGETGLIRPDEYVRSVELTENVSAGTPIKLKIMSYEPDTYYSLGSVSVNTSVTE